jgi:hypothetical protein
MDTGSGFENVIEPTLIYERQIFSGDPISIK